MTATNSKRNIAHIHRRPPVSVSREKLLNYGEWTRAHTKVLGTFLMGWTEASALEQDALDFIGNEFNIHAWYAQEENHKSFTEVTPSGEVERVRKTFGWFLQADGGWNPSEDDYLAFQMVDKVCEKGWLFNLRQSARKWKAGFLKMSDLAPAAVLEEVSAKHTNRPTAICFAALHALDLPQKFHI